MRTIRFRGKRIDNKEWVYGYLYKLPLPSGEACMILTQDNNHLDNSLEPKYHLAFTLWVDLFIVDPSTIDLFTGFSLDGVGIYEGDILKCHYNREVNPGVVVYYGGSFGLTNDDPFRHFESLYQFFWGSESGYEIIGNIHDNPELLGKEGGEE